MLMHLDLQRRSPFSYIPEAFCCKVFVVRTRLAVSYVNGGLGYYCEWVSVQRGGSVRSEFGKGRCEKAGIIWCVHS